MCLSHILLILVPKLVVSLPPASPLSHPPHNLVSYSLLLYLLFGGQCVSWASKQYTTHLIVGVCHNIKSQTCVVGDVRRRNVVCVCLQILLLCVVFIPRVSLILLSKLKKLPTILLFKSQHIVQRH